MLSNYPTVISLLCLISLASAALSPSCSLVPLPASGTGAVMLVPVMIPRGMQAGDWDEPWGTLTFSG